MANSELLTTKGGNWSFNVILKKRQGNRLSLFSLLHCFLIINRFLFYSTIGATTPEPETTICTVCKGRNQISASQISSDLDGCLAFVLVYLLLFFMEVIIL